MTTLKQDLLTSIDDLRAQVGALEKQVRTLRIEKRELSEEQGLSDEVIRLKKKITELEISESKLAEKNARERREVEHMVGLERSRQTFEVEQAKRETSVELREAALAEQRKRFEEQMKFIENRLADEVRYLKDDIVKALLERLPTWTTDRKIVETVGANGNGSHEEE